MRQPDIPDSRSSPPDLRDAVLVRLALHSLGAGRAWRVRAIEFRSDEPRIVVRIEPRSVASVKCAVCSAPAIWYDTRPRYWDHTPLWGARAIIRALVPRAKCPLHGVRLVRVPWAAERSRMTVQLGEEIRARAQQSTPAEIARQVGLTWERVKATLAKPSRAG